MHRHSVLVPQEFAAMHNHGLISRNQIMKHIENIVNIYVFLWRRRHSAGNAVNRAAFDAQTVGVRFATCPGTPNIIETAVRRTHDVAAIAIDADTTGFIRHRARHCLGTHADLQCVGFAGATVTFRVNQVERLDLRWGRVR